MKTYHITKWALTEGIVEAPGKAWEGVSEAARTSIECYHSHWQNGRQLFHGNDAHETREDALKGVAAKFNLTYTPPAGEGSK